MLKVIGPIVKGAAVREREVHLGDGKCTRHGMELSRSPCVRAIATRNFIKGNTKSLVHGRVRIPLHSGSVIIAFKKVRIVARRLSPDVAEVVKDTAFGAGFIHTAATVAKLTAGMGGKMSRV